MSSQPVVLICENPLIENYLAFVLTREGRRVIFSRPKAALEMVQSGDVRVELLITNQPGAFLTIADSLPFLYLSACPDGDIASHFPKLRVLRKPFRTADLVSAVNELTRAA